MNTSAVENAPRSSWWMLGWLGFSSLVVLADQVSKAWFVAFVAEHGRVDVLPVLQWVMVYNEGAAFSFLSSAGGWQRYFLALVAVAVTLWLILELWRLPGSQRLWASAFSLIIGGALGNLIDRLWLGAVRDFIAVHWQHAYFPAFNLADVAISLGAGAWFLAAFLQWKRARPT